MRFLVSLVWAAYVSLLLVLMGVGVACGYGAWVLFGLLGGEETWGQMALVVVGIVGCLGGFALGVCGLIPFGRRLALTDVPVAREAFSGLWEWLGKLCEAVDVACPKRLVCVPAVNATASYHGGLPGVLRNERKLSVGLPLLYALPSKQLAAVAAHELGHFRDASAMKACAFAYEVEGMFWRMTRGVSVSLRRRIVAKQRIEPLVLIALCYASVCESLLGAFLGFFVRAASILRNRLLAEMEYRADAVAAQLMGPKVVIDALGSMFVLAGVEQALNGQAPEVPGPKMPKPKDPKEIARAARKRLGKVKLPPDSELDPVIRERLARLRKMPKARTADTFSVDAISEVEIDRWRKSLIQ